jgi:transcriptional regulator with XRE-family HTH domain
MNLDQNEKIKFGLYLKSLRENCRMTQRQVTDAAQISGCYLSQVERGERKPPNSAMLCRLARAYKVPEEDVLRAAGHLQEALAPTMSDRQKQVYFQWRNIRPRDTHFLRLLLGENGSTFMSFEDVFCRLTERECAYLEAYLILYSGYINRMGA